MADEDSRVPSDADGERSSMRVLVVVAVVTVLVDRVLTALEPMSGLTRVILAWGMAWGLLVVGRRWWSPRVPPQ